jgi:hypothetical protein
VWTHQPVRARQARGYGGEGEGEGQGGADVRLCPRGHARVRTDASVLYPGNFITDATVRRSHGRPSGHHLSVYLSVRPSVRYRPRDSPTTHVEVRNVKPISFLI